MKARIVSTTYEVVNGLGTLLATFSDPVLAIGWIRRQEGRHHGMSLKEVTLLRHEETIALEMAA